MKQHFRVATSVSAGLASLPGQGRAASCAQALWLLLAGEGVFQFTRTVQYHGRRAELFVTKTKVTIQKPGRRRTPAGSTFPARR